MDITHEQRLAMRVIDLDNTIHDVVKAHLSWLPMFKITVPEFLEYYEKHGIHNIHRVVKD